MSTSLNAAWSTKKKKPIEAGSVNPASSMENNLNRKGQIKSWAQGAQSAAGAPTKDKAIVQATSAQRPATPSFGNVSRPRQISPEEHEAEVQRIIAERKQSYSENMDRQKQGLTQQIQGDTQRLKSVVGEPKPQSEIMPLTNRGAAKQLKEIGIEVETVQSEMEKKRRAAQAAQSSAFRRTNR